MSVTSGRMEWREGGRSCHAVRLSPPKIKNEVYKIKWGKKEKRKKEKNVLTALK